jgi:hypothetical protein
MKSIVLVALTVDFTVHALQVTDDTMMGMTPVNRVLNLIRNLQKEVEKDGKLEQKSYDKYACWCEATLERKAKDISDAKVKIDKLSELILKLKGDLGEHSAEIASLKKWIAQNLAEQKEATEVRDKENADFEAGKQENEQCIGALESAITVLTGAGAGKAGFLELKQAQLMSAASDVGRVLRNPVATQATSTADLEALRKFLERPMDFSASRRSTVLSSLEVSNKHNPFGEYAPQSTQIQGILKGMYDAFTADLEKDNAEESDKQKAFEEYIATKQKELATLRETLENQELDQANKAKEEADSQTERDDTQKQLEEDEAFFELTKQTCREKAQQWSERSRLRSEELTGIMKAIAIIDSPESRAIFANSSTTFLQLEASPASSFLQFAGASEHRSGGGGSSLLAHARARAYASLATAAAKYSSMGLARIATVVKAGGHFDKVISMIDAMIELLRKEEARDIMHRDLCQNGIDKNKKDIAEAQHVLEVTAASIDEMNGKVKVMLEEIKQLERDISDTEMDMEERLEMRNKEQYAFEQSVKDDVAAIDIVNKAIVAMSAFYKKNKIDLSLAQGHHRQAPDVEYTVDQDKAPELAWGKEGGAYGGRKEDTGGLVAILEMIATDIQHEVDTARKDDAVAEAEYEKERKAMADLLQTLKENKIATEQKVADTNKSIAEKTQLHAETEEELKVQKSLSATLAGDCDWVKTHFTSRREKRKTEMDALAQAKNILAGAETGNYDEMTLETGSTA